MKHIFVFLFMTAFFGSLSFGDAGENSGKFGSLSIASKPANANIYINDKFVGTAPVVVDSLPEQQVSVRWELSGYRPSVHDISVIADSVQVLGARMIKYIVPLVIQIDTGLDHAQIFINNDFAGQKKCRVTMFNSGPYTIRISADNYNTLLDTLIFTENTVINKQYDLRPKMTTMKITANFPQGRLIMKNRNRDEEFYLSGTKVRDFADSVIFPYETKIQTGVYGISLSLPGYYTIDRTLKLNAQDLNSFSFDFKQGVRDYQGATRQIYTNSGLVLCFIGLAKYLKNLADQSYRDYRVESDAARVVDLRIRSTRLFTASQLSYGVAAAFGVNASFNLYKMTWISKSIHYKEWKAGDHE